MRTEKQPDRVSYSFGRKVSGTGSKRYHSYDVHVSYSTDVRDGEAVEDAIKRAARIVEKRVDRKVKEKTGEDA